MDAERKKNFVRLMLCSLLTAFLVSVVLMILYSVGDNLVRKSETERKKELLRMIAESPELTAGEKANILNMFRERYNATYEGDGFYRKLVSALIASRKGAATRIAINGKCDIGYPEKLKSIVIVDGKRRWQIDFFATTLSVSHVDCMERGYRKGKTARYDILGNKVAECEISGPGEGGYHAENGTVWELVIGLKGVKWSDIVTYKSGFEISRKPYKGEQIEKLLEEAAKFGVRPQ